MATKNIIIRERQEESLKGMYHYCEVIGTKYFNRCKLPWFKNLKKGDIFNVYYIKYVEDGTGRVKEWIAEVKHGCEYDGVSVETSFAALDKELTEYYTNGDGRFHNNIKPLELFLFKRNGFTENQAGAVTREQACTLAEDLKEKRQVWRFNLDCGTFDADYERGAIDLNDYWVRTM